MPDISAISTESVWLPVRAVHPTLGFQDLTADTVDIAIVPAGVDPTSPDWHSATWETATVTVGGLAYNVASILVGPTPGAVTLTAGLTYDAYVRVTASPEKAVLRVGTLVAY